MSQNNSVRTLQRRHWGSAGLLLSLAALQLGVMLGTLAWLTEPPTAVNIAGRQRMLSQQIALFAGQLARVEASDRPVVAEQLTDALDSMARQHRGLTTGDAELGLRGALNPALREAYYGEGTALDRRVTEFVAHGRRLLDARTTQDRIRASSRIHSESAQLLPHLETAASLHAQHVEASQRWAWYTLGALFGLNLLGIVVCWVVLIRPSLRGIQRDQKRLLDVEAQRTVAEATRAYQRQVDEAIELVEDEDGLMKVISRATLELTAEAPLEVLLSDNSEAHMKVAAQHPHLGGPGCGVSSPWRCPALRRGQVSIFPDSESLNACPSLAGRECAAACVPLTFMGESLGVMHATFPRGADIPEDYLRRLQFLSTASATRLSTLRSFAKVQLQATTDPLTGLLNRRALEVEVKKLVLSKTPFALGMADLDHFKRLNDTYGHDAGDRALVTFSKTVRDSLRPTDLVARFGGEEFVMVFADSDADQAADALARVQIYLAHIVAGSDTPTFTASYGVSDTRVGTNLATLIQVADSALLRAKEAGRDRVVVADMGEASRPDEHTWWNETLSEEAAREADVDPPADSHAA